MPFFRIPVSQSHQTCLTARVKNEEKKQYQIYIIDFPAENWYNYVIGRKALPCTHFSVHNRDMPMAERNFYMYYKELLKRTNELMERVYNIGGEIAIWEDEKNYGNDPVKLYSTTATTYEHIKKWLKDMDDLDMERAKYEVKNRSNNECSGYEKTYHILSYALYPLRNELSRTKTKIELFMLEHKI